eukprot:CAMPEP_0175139630 /NCGR_PEP_ID=MMETSP0087-20121206/11017_1 /TAXON_ID=136419 /ORGANISM="Unknown Unknown, Strain D1" /LENGTH=66 /DNA_ID=CAMNT_0016422677 /DNA_START=106 /DNA_END=306 /DNA_ORIENTATION=-
MSARRGAAPAARACAEHRTAVQTRPCDCEGASSLTHYAAAALLFPPATSSSGRGALQTCLQAPENG